MANAFEGFHTLGEGSAYGWQGRNAWTLMNAIAKQFPNYNFASGMNHNDGLYRIYAYRQKDAGTTLPEVGQQPLLEVVVPNILGDEEVQTVFTKIALVCG